MKAYDKKCEGCRWKWEGDRQIPICAHPEALEYEMQFSMRDHGPCGREALLYQEREEQR